MRTLKYQILVAFALLVVETCNAAQPVCKVAATGPNALVGSIGGGPDAALFSGYNVLILQNGKLVVHDPVTARLLLFARGKKESFNCSAPELAIQLDGAPISSIVENNEIVYGIDIDGNIRQIYPEQAARKQGEFMGASGADHSANRDQLIGQLAVSHPFRDSRSVWPGVHETPGEKSRESGEISLSPEGNRLTSVPNGLILINGVEYRHSFNWTGTGTGTGEVTIKKADAPNSSILLPVKVPENIGAVDIAGSKSGGFTVVVESFGLDDTKKIRVVDHYFSYDAKGALLNHRVISVPKSSARGSWAPINAPLMSDPLNENNAFYFFRSEDSVVVIEAELRNEKANKISRKSSDIRFIDPDDKRKMLLARAEKFINVSWITSERNLNATNKNWKCSAPYAVNEHRWGQPIFLQNQGPGKTIYGVPYLWGGKRGWEDFIQKVNAGDIAGNVCTKRVNGKTVAVPNSAGVDCSGFISRVWELSKDLDLSTTAIGTDKFSSQIDSLAELQPGDVFNKAGSHVRLFAGWIRTPFGLRVRSYESTTDSICSGTCMRDLRVRAFIGYSPRGYPE